MIPSTALLAVNRSSEKVVLNNSYVSGNSNASLRLNADGLAYQGVNGTYSSLYSWLVTGLLANYEAYASGTGFTGTTGTWLPLTTTRTWTTSSPPGYDNVGNLSLQIRNKNTLVVLATATITLDAANL